MQIPTIKKKRAQRENGVGKARVKDYATDDRKRRERRLKGQEEEKKKEKILPNKKKEHCGSLGGSVS